MREYIFHRCGEEGGAKYNCTQVPASSVMACPPKESMVLKEEVGENIAKALRQVACIPKVEYMRFDGDPIKYVSFVHNFAGDLSRERKSRQCETFLALNSTLVW